MNILKYTRLLVGMCLLAACSKEDDLVAEYDNPADFFMPAADAHDETSELRRDFFSKTGSYLLFNDTLQHHFLGYDYNDDPVYFTELLNIDYTIGSYNAAETNYIYEYLTTIEEQRAALDYLEKNILIHLSGKVKPYSWMLVNRITGTDNRGYRLTPYCVAGQRCTAISCYLIPTLKTEAQLNRFNINLLQTIVGRIVSNHQTEFADFYAVSNAWYSGVFEFVDDADNTEKLRDKGFLIKGSSSGSLSNGSCPTMEADLAEYSRQIISYPEETLERNYGKYPLVMQKFALMRRIMTDLGYKF